ncbi:MAG: 50S ribosomal protein L11 methyltransferase [Oscillospiraceae bacterium]|nr:50S ribosomal protein L11 methyltransferase [Oscillospiraceae bacterium]
MRWLEITLNTSHSELEALTARLIALGVDGLITEDEEEIRRFLEDNRKYWDYVDEDFASSIRGVSRVKFYLEDTEGGKAELKRLESAMPDKEFSVVPVKDEDWENNWKEYYKPITVGERLVIVPSWLPIPEDCGDRAALRLDPGLIFGTGAHPTTRMCLLALQKNSGAGKRVLDLGCGSGILAIAALLLGCDRAIGVDIDEKAPPVVMENAALNGIGADRLSAFAGDVTADSDLARRLREEKFEIVTANIVADVIIGISKKARELTAPGGVFITSGIIEGREAEVESALRAAGFKIEERYNVEGWHAFVCTGE